MSDIVYRAMVFARKAHAKQVRKYTNEPYVVHLAEVAGIVSSISDFFSVMPEQKAIAQCIAWLHDTVEDTDVTRVDLMQEFGEEITTGVIWLTDQEEGNRATRMAGARARLEQADAMIQTIKVADMISNTSSIIVHDKNFAPVYLEEKKLLLDVLTKADPRLIAIARGIQDEYQRNLLIQ